MTVLSIDLPYHWFGRVLAYNVTAAIVGSKFSKTAGNVTDMQLLDYVGWVSVPHNKCGVDHVLVVERLAPAGFNKRFAELCLKSL